VARYRIELAYDGGGFHGYAAQPGLRTVQGELESALAHHLPGVETVVAGRTDAGVHARAQVVSFAGPDDLDTVGVARSLNKLLGPEVAVMALDRAADGFDARFDAIGRRYRYHLHVATAADPLTRHVRWHVPPALDIDAMNAATAHFVGEHDFASLCRGAGVRTTERTVTAADWAAELPLATYRVSGSAFCHQMVRSMVALSVAVGRGRVAADTVPGILAARDRNASRGAAPPHGLILWAIEYPS
jgi:tRNA pseudouridine38-40 synthase